MAFPKNLFLLGPLLLLFLLYTNDIENCSELVSVMLFADDTNILYSHTCLKALDTSNTGVLVWLERSFVVDQIQNDVDIYIYIYLCRQYKRIVQKEIRFRK